MHESRLWAILNIPGKEKEKEGWEAGLLLQEASLRDLEDKYNERSLFILNSFIEV